MSDKKITCQICGSLEHAIQHHLVQAHPDWTIERYKETFPEAELLSPLAKSKLQERMAAKAASAAVIDLAEARGDVKIAFHELFGFGENRLALAANGNPIMITRFGSAETPELIPDEDKAYIFDIALTKKVIIALQLNKPMLAWGYHGTGKTSLIDQVHAKTRRPLIRVQHTINTEEAHILGQTLVKGGETYFSPGPLAEAMRYGWSYLADEYDGALPHVTQVYQPVLEGKPLIIKEAPPEWRVVRPHANFRFFATGNTNGSGDETGMYQGTQLGNAANYSRFAITVQVPYMEPKVEAAIVASQARISISDANLLVDFAKEVRNNYISRNIGATISPRELINAAILGVAQGGRWREGLNDAFINRLSRVDMETVRSYAQRVFGGE